MSHPETTTSATFKKTTKSLGFKLFLILSLVIVLAIGPLTFSALQSLNHYGKKAIGLSEQQIRSQTISSLAQISRERAARYQEYFDRIAASAALLGSQAAAIHADIELYAKAPLHDYIFRKQEKNSVWANQDDDQVVTMFWGAPQISEEVHAELRAMSHMTPLFQQVLQENPDVLASHSISASGIGQYCTNNPKYQKAALDIPSAAVFDLRHGEPVTIFTDSGYVQKEVQWTNVYKDDVNEGFMLTASAPVYDHYDNFLGITGIDVPLTTVINDILHSDDTYYENLIHFSFLLDPDGKIIALPQTHYQLLGLSIDHSSYLYSSDRLNTYLWESSNDAVKEMVYRARSHQEHWTELTLQDEDYYFVTSKMAGLDWIFGMVARENDMLSFVAQSRTELDKTVKNMAAKGVLFSLMTISIAILIIYSLLKYLITPLRRLVLATEQVAAGDLTVRSPVTSDDEVGILASSFNSMVAQLEKIRDEQQTYTNFLEEKVKRRSSALVQQQNELEKTIEQLNREVERRQIVAGALRNSQQQYYDTLESSKAGVCIIEEGRFIYVNTSFAETIFHSSKAEMIGKQPLQLICEEDHQLVKDNMAKRFQGEDIPPYTIKCRRPDGTTFYGEIWSKMSTWQNKKVLVGTINDVSVIKKNEERLRIQDRRLQESLAEKEVLLKEIYHRTKNNMLVIISMLELQSADIEDKRLKTIFLEMENRIRSMALVHEKLYQSRNLAQIDGVSYLKDVAESLLSSMVVDGRISLLVNTEPLPVSIDYAIPLGLVTNEIITNSIQHAFPDTRQGTISISFGKAEKNTLLLTIADNGIGLPVDIDAENSSSFGMGIIINTLVKLQLKGQIAIERNNGTRYSITFPEPHTARRI